MPVYNRIKNISIVDPNDPTRIAGVTASGELKVSTSVTLESQEITVENVAIRDGTNENYLAHIDSEGNVYTNISSIPPVTVDGVVQISGEGVNDGTTTLRDKDDPARVARVSESGDVHVYVSNDPLPISGDVNIISGIVQVQYTGSNLKFDDTDKDYELTNGSYVTIYNHPVSGEVSEKLMHARLVFDSNDIDVKVTVDSTILMNDDSLYELYRDYRLDGIAYNSLCGPIIKTDEQGRVLDLNFHPDGIKFYSLFKIEAKANRDSVYLERGRVTRVEGD